MDQVKEKKPPKEDNDLGQDFNFFSLIKFAVPSVFSYHYGTGNNKMKAKVFRLSMMWILILSVLLAVAFYLFREPVVELFFDKGTQIF